MTEATSTPQERAAIAEYVQQRFRESGGQARLEDELRELALDILGRVDPGQVGRPCSESVQRITRAAVAASVEPLVARFMAELVRGIVGLPAETQGMILSGGCRRDFRFG